VGCDEKSVIKNLRVVLHFFCKNTVYQSDRHSNLAGCVKNSVYC